MEWEGITNTLHGSGKVSAQNCRKIGTDRQTIQDFQIDLRASGVVANDLIARSQIIVAVPGQFSL
jgi:hypothetical protein